jgi:uroporphyrin-III C-methyltransferase
MPSATPRDSSAAVHRAGSGSFSSKRTDRFPKLISAAVALSALAVTLAGGALWAVWATREHSAHLEQDLVRRLQTGNEQAAEVRLLARQSQDQTRDALAKVTLLETRLAEVALQRSQVEELIQSFARSRDENVLVDIDAAIRVAMQQTVITGSVEPLVNALRASDDRLARIRQPRLERVRRALATDLDRVRGVTVTDLGTLLLRLDEAARLVDELPLVARGVGVEVSARGGAKAASAGGGGASGVISRPWSDGIWSEFVERLGLAWDDIRGLIRVTRIDQPEAALIAPDQTFFLRENLKLRLMNARLALLSRQSEVVRADLQAAQAALEKYFDASSKRTQMVAEALRLVLTQSRSAALPQPDGSLAAIAAAMAVAAR